MKVAYIAGPYRAKHGRTVIENVRAAEQIAIKYWRLGYAVICPHLNTAFFDGLMKDGVWLEGDLEIIKRCDVVVMIAGWEMSDGAREEHTVAVLFDKEIIYEAEGQ